jgi:hypothetical protein
MTDPIVKITIPAPRAKRNFAIGLGLIAFVAIIYVVTLVKLNIHGGS